MTLHIRSVLHTDSPLDRPLQAFHSTREAARQWADNFLSLYPNGEVRLYETTETQIEVIKPSAPQIQSGAKTTA